jgi:Na+/H+ antiporter NhaC
MANIGNSVEDFLLRVSSAAICASQAPTSSAIPFMRAMISETSPPTFLMAGISRLALFCSALRVSARTVSARRSSSMVKMLSIVSSMGLPRRRIAAFTIWGSCLMTLISNIIYSPFFKD